MWKLYNTFYVWRAVWCLPNELERRLEQPFGGIVHEIKAKRKNGFYTSRLPKNEEIKNIFVLSSKEL
jgi:hypothetical protein